MNPRTRRLRRQQRRRLGTARATYEALLGEGRRHSRAMQARVAQCSADVKAGFPSTLTWAPPVPWLRARFAAARAVPHPRCQATRRVDDVEQQCTRGSLHTDLEGHAWGEPWGRVLPTPRCSVLVKAPGRATLASPEFSLHDLPQFAELHLVEPGSTIEVTVSADVDVFVEVKLAFTAYDLANAGSNRQQKRFFRSGAFTPLLGGNIRMGFCAPGVNLSPAHILAWYEQHGAHARLLTHAWRQLPAEAHGRA